MAQDVKLEKNGDGIYDIPIVNGDFALVDGIETALGVSLFTDARESEGNVQDAFRRGGWSGNILTLNDDFELGSTLWSLIARMVQDTFNLGEGKVRLSLQWMIDLTIVDTIDVLMTQNGSRSSKIEIVLFKNLSEVGRYITLLTNTETF